MKKIETFIAKMKHKIIDDIDYNMVSQGYVDSFTSIKTRCLKHNCDIYLIPTNIVRQESKHICYQCQNEKYIDNINSLFPNLEVDDLTFSKHKVHTTCKCCGKTNVQRYHTIVNGKGCKTCNQTYLRDQQINIYKHKLKLKFGDKFKYDFSKYRVEHNSEDIEFICNIHGIQVQNIYHHIESKHGCSQCGNLHSFTHSPLTYLKENPMKGNIPGMFYKLKFTHIKSNLQFMKIGITSLGVKERFRKDIKDFIIEEIEIINTTMLEAAQLEYDFKQLNIQHRFFIPPSIKFDGYTECYFLEETVQVESKTLPLIRESLLIKQNNKCPICEKDIKKPVVDHEHKKRIGGSGKIRQVICSSCNILLAKFENNVKRYGLQLSDMPFVLRNLADYHEEAEKNNLIHPTEKPKERKVSKRNYNKLKKAYLESNKKAKFPEYPKSKKLTVKLKELFEEFKIEAYN